ncbi:MAG TPA: hypothetical protein VHV99_12930, partial [Paraburkholderia sp.]|nr:hypothetical protein [Paraburkholderia sp.]
MRLCIKKPPGRQLGLSARWLDKARSGERFLHQSDRACLATRPSANIKNSKRLAELIENRGVIER